MAEESIILRVGIDENQLKKSEEAIVSARGEIDKLKEANKELEKQGQKNSVEFVRNQVAMKDLSNTVRENERVLDANAKMQRSANGSIAEQRELLKTLQAEYVNLSAEERNNEKVGGALQKQIKAQSDSLKGLEKDIGITGRNVGNYTSDILSAVDGTGLFSKAQAALGSASKLMSGGIDGAKTATQGFGMALKAAGIGLILTVLASLIALLTRTQEGMDFVAKATAAVGTFVGTLIDALSTLGQQIVDQVVPVFMGLKDILVGIATLDFEQVKAGAQGVGNAVSQIDSINLVELGAAAAKAAEEAFKLQGELINVGKAEKEMAVVRSRQKAQIQELREASQDETLSYKERAAALKQASNIEETQLNASLVLAAERLRILKEQNALTKSTEEDIQRERDAEIALNDLKTESTRNQIKLDKQLKAINSQAAAAAKAAAAERKQLEEKALKDKLDAEKKAEEERKALQKKTNDDFKAALKQQTDDTNLIIRDSINALKSQFADGVIDLETYQEQLDQVEALALQTRQEAVKAQLEQNKTNAEIDAETRLAIEQDLQNQLRAIEDQEISAAVKRQEEKLDAEKKAGEEEVANAKAVADAKIQALNAVLGAAINIFGAQSAAGKIAASFQALVDTYAAANQALATIPPPFGQIVAAATVATGLANVAKINSTPPPKFAEGGGIEISGPSHAGGGVPVQLGGRTVAEVEGGEGLFVMKKNAFQSLRALSNFNQSFGGKSWLSGGQRYLADGGAVARTAAPQLDRRSLQDAQRSFQEGIGGLQVVAKISDINRVNKEVQQVEVQGDLR